MKRIISWAGILLVLFILLCSCSAYEPLAKPYGKSIVSDLAAGDRVGLRLDEGKGIEVIREMKIQEILGDSVLVGIPIIKGSENDAPRRIQVSQIEGIGKGHLGADSTLTLYFIAFWVFVAGIGTIAL